MTATGRRLLRFLGGALPTGRGGVSILAYHLVGGGTDSPVDLPLETFERQLRELGECGRVVPMSAALRRLDDGGGPDEHWIVLTFDDAYRNFTDTVRPLLEERRLPATVYVPTGFVDGVSPGPLDGAQQLAAASWSELRELAASSLFSIGSHTVSHPDLRRLAPDELRRELTVSRDRIEEELGAAVIGFCYPRALWSRGVRSAVEGIYDHAVIAGGSRNRSEGWDRYLMQRLPVRRDMPASAHELLAKAVWLEEWAASRLRRAVS